MSLTKDELVGKKVYNADASYIGQVSDIGFAVGLTNPALIVRIDEFISAEIPWEKVGFIKDIILTKEVVDLKQCKMIQTGAHNVAPSQPVASAYSSSPPVQRQATAPPPQPQPPLVSSATDRFCPKCGKKATWIDRYSRFYCYKCKEYLP